MLKVAYLANRFPSAVEPYVIEEIEELRRRGVCVIASSVRNPDVGDDKLLTSDCPPEIVLQPLRVVILLKAAWLCVRKWRRISDLMWRVIWRGREWPMQRVKALLHTWMGACYAVQLKRRGVEHIHAHHGYFGSWIAMVAARLLRVPFSLTLHGSDLLLHGKYLDLKLENCEFCLTVSEYNRRLILKRYPKVAANKVVVSRLGVKINEPIDLPPSRCKARSAPLMLLTVGRLHAVKDHAFLVRACAQLHTRGVEFECSIAGDGPERRRLESLIRKLGLEERVTLLGHVPREQMDSLYDRADVVVLTSRSEGIPLVLMEAMARGKIVLAPDITGIPELVIAGKTGFLYEAGSQGDFVARLLLIDSLMPATGVRDHPDICIQHSHTLAARRLAWMPHAARVQVRLNFNRSKNLESFGEFFIEQTVPQKEKALHENSLLQQIQLPVQWNRGAPVRTDGVDEGERARSSVVLNG
jgi:colanic acid/amylovoran biosynthesis glycosyltransferase